MSVEQLRIRLSEELSDNELATKVVEALTPELIDDLTRLSHGAFATTPALNYQPDTVAAAEITALVVYAYGYRLAPGFVPVDGAIPPMDQLLPGPTNEALAHQAALFSGRHHVPVIAQWEIARLLEQQHIGHLISVEPDTGQDGSVIYLSTAGVIEKGLRLASEAAVDTSHIGVLGHADHAVRCLATTRAAGVVAHVPEGVALPIAFDAQSGQMWTRDRATWIVTDLFARANATNTDVDMADLAGSLRNLHSRR